MILRSFLILTAIYFAVPVIAEVGGDTASFAHDGYVREEVRAIGRYRNDYSSGGNTIEWNAIRDQLPEQNVNYAVLRVCVTGKADAETVKLCLQNTGFCELYADLRSDQSIPVGAVLVYHKPSLGLNPIAIKTGVHNYYSGINLELPNLPDADRKLVGIFLPPPCGAQAHVTRR